MHDDIMSGGSSAQLDDHGRRRLPGGGYTIHACSLRPPRSRSYIASASDCLRIFANYLSDTEGFDLRMMLERAAVPRGAAASSLRRRPWRTGDTRAR